MITSRLGGGIQNPAQNRLIRLVQVLFLISLVFLLWNIADGQTAAQLLLSADPFLLLASLVALSMQTVLSALRWRIAAQQLGIQLGRRIAMREYFQAQIANQSLPGGVLGDAGRVLRSSQQAGWLKSAQAVLMERLAGQVALFALYFLALAVTSLIGSGPILPRWLLVIFLIVFLAIFFLIASAIVIGQADKGSIGSFIQKVGSLFRVCLLQKDIRVAQIGLSLGSAAANIFAFVFAARAIGSEISFLEGLVLVPVILLAMLIPLTIGGWGFREAVAAAMFPLIGSLAAEGLAASVAFGLVFLVSSLPGLAITMLIAKKPKGVNK